MREDNPHTRFGEQHGGNTGYAVRPRADSTHTSPVLHPEIDFHAIAAERFAVFSQQGVRFVASTDPLPF